MNKQIVFDYLRSKKETYKNNHRIVLATNGECKKLDNDEFGKVAIHGKSRYKTKHVQNGYWRAYGL